MHRRGKYEYTEMNKMKVRFVKHGLINDHYAVVENCCDHYKHIKEILWHRKEGFFFILVSGGMGGVVPVRFNYCPNCGAKTEIIDEMGNPQPLPNLQEENSIGETKE